MKVRIAEIPPEGLDLEFDLDVEALNQRLAPVSEKGTKLCLDSADTQFVEPVRASLKLTLEGTTVFLHGRASGNYSANCARCAETTIHETSVRVDVLLKPAPTRLVKSGMAEEEGNLDFGYYDGQEIECVLFPEELLVASIPYVILCQENCRGLCARCGKNLNESGGICDCPPEESVGETENVFKKLKALIQ